MRGAGCLNSPCRTSSGACGTSDSPPFLLTSRGRKTTTGKGGGFKPLPNNVRRERGGDRRPDGRAAFHAGYDGAAESAGRRGGPGDAAGRAGHVPAAAGREGRGPPDAGGDLHRPGGGGRGRRAGESRGRPVTAVGTTVVRTLESAARAGEAGMTGDAAPAARRPGRRRKRENRAGGIPRPKY